MAKTHPHIDDPTLSQLGELVTDRPDAIRETYLALHRLVVETLPDVKNSVDTTDGAIGYGAHQYGYNGWGMGAVTPFTNWVSLMLFAGPHLPDPAGLLVGTSAHMRHVKPRTPAEVAQHEAAITELLLAAQAFHRPA
jgi:hypothetical protein